MSWIIYLKGFKSFLQLEKSLSANSVEAYLHDVEKLYQYVSARKDNVELAQLELSHLQDFLAWINELGMSPTSQARIISGLKSFFQYLVLENILNRNPTELLEAPKTRRKLPDTLSIEELQLIFDSHRCKHGRRHPQ
jgi:integrase/recombinase XerD